MADLALLIAMAVMVGLALTWVNLKAGVTWLKFLSMVGVVGCFAIAGIALFKMAELVY